MREIKFRAWDGEKIILDGETLIRSNEWWYGKPNENGLPLGSFSGIDGHVLMQYTGLKDKNGKEIYEGDIVDLPITDFCAGGGCCNQYIEGEGGNSGRMRRVVEYDIGTFWINPHGSTNSVEVIGNIYEHPELL